MTLLENPFPLSNIYTSYFPLHRIQGEAPSPQFWNPLRMPSPSDLERINRWHFYALPNFGTTNLFVIQILQIYSYQRPSEVPRMCANHVAAGALPQIPLGKLTYQWGGEKPPPHQLGCMGANPTPAVSPLGLSVPHPHDFLTPLQFYFSRNMPEPNSSRKVMERGVYIWDQICALRYSKGGAQCSQISLEPLLGPYRLTYRSIKCDVVTSNPSR